MINAIGTFSSIWLALWLALSVLFLLVYPLVRPLLLSLHPRHGSALLLAWWVLPLAASLSSTLFLFMPSAENLLVDAHCHDDCASHVPLIGSAALAWFGVAIGSLAVAALLVRFVTTLRKSRQLHMQFDFLGKRRGAWFEMESECPLVFTLGWWQPRIYVSTGLRAACSPEDMEIILQHERAHQERRDNLRLLVARLCCAILPGPLARRVLADLQVVTEEACDFRAAERFGAVSVAQTLLKVKRLLMMHPSAVPQEAMAFAERDVEIRIKALLRAAGRVALPAWQLSLLVATGVLALALMVEPLHHSSEWVISVLSSPATHVH
jgi:Zn-dependent protease with chaperone function